MTQPTPIRPAVSRQLRDRLRDNALRSPLADQVAGLVARRQLHPPVVVTATGPVYLVEGRLRWAAPDVALRRVQELHGRATGHTGPFRTTLPATLTPGQAFRAYSNALVALLAQLAVLPTAERAHLATSLAAYATRTGSLDGLEAVFLSAARAAQRANDRATLAAMATTFARVGLPRTLGGGALTAPLLDVRSGQLVLVSATRLHRAGLTPSGNRDLAAFSSSVSSLFAAPHPDAGRSAGDSPFADGVADYIQIGAAIGAAVGAVAGAVLGAGTPVSVPAALAGAATGAQLGATVGGIVGLIIGTEVSIEATPPAPPSEPHDGGLPGGVGGGDGDDAPGGSGGGSGGGEGGNSGGGGSGGGGSGGSGGGGSGGGDEGGQPPAPDPGGSGEGGFPNPDDPGGDDGGESVSTRVPAGSGLGALTSYIGGNSFTITGLPRLGDEGGGNGGFLSGVPGFGSTDPADAGARAEPVSGSLRAHEPVSIPSGRVIDPLPDGFTGVVERPGPGNAGR